MKGQVQGKGWLGGKEAAGVCGVGKCQWRCGNALFCFCPGDTFLRRYLNSVVQGTAGTLASQPIRSQGWNPDAPWVIPLQDVDPDSAGAAATMVPPSPHQQYRQQQQLAAGGGGGGGGGGHSGSLELAPGGSLVQTGHGAAMGGGGGGVQPPGMRGAPLSLEELTRLLEVGATFSLPFPCPFLSVPDAQV